MYDDLSGVQIEILDFIKDELNKRGFPPSVREICTSVGLSSTSSVHHQLNNLEKKGYLKRDPLKPRAMEVLNANPFVIRQEIVDVPIIGKVTAGEPILAVENYEDTFPLPVSFTNNSDCFILSVAGNSMINAGILDGDYVIVKQQNIARNGDIIVALIEDEATVKTFYKEENRIRLQPENPMMAPIYSKNVQVLGRVIGVIRKM